MKYIIDIEDEPFARESDKEKLYLSQFTPVVFAERELHSMTPYDESEIKQRGQEEAWKLACHLYNVSPDVTDVIYRSMNGGKGLGVALEMPYAEAREKYEAWKEQKDIKVGDEVSFAGNVFVVTSINDQDTIPDTINGIGKNGETFSMKDKKKWHKTGRSFPIVDLLEKMREPE